jgi:predicted PurR-regulated permease PerM
MSSSVPNDYQKAFVAQAPESLDSRSLTVRMVSLIVLGILIFTLGLTFFQILSAFLLPMFLAGILTIICQPIYSYFLRRFNNKRYWAAGVTTTALVSIIMIPTVVGILIGSLQLYTLATHHLDADNWSQSVDEVAQRLNIRKAAEWLQKTFPEARIDEFIEGLDKEAEQVINGQSSNTESEASTTSDPAADAEGVGVVKNANSPEVPSPLEKSETQFEELGKAAGNSSKLGIETATTSDEVTPNENHRDGKGMMHPVELEIRKREEEIRMGLQNFFVQMVQTTLTPGNALSSFNILASLSWSAMGVVIFIIAIYYFLADGPALLKASEEMIPVNTEHQRRLYQQFAIAVRAVMTSTMLAAGGQGIATSAMLWFLGFGHFFLYTIVCTLAALIPLGGIWLVWFPCMIILFWDGSYFWGTVLFLYGFFVVGTIDNVLRAYILNSDAKLHPLLAFVTILGGLQAMGLWGVFIAPIVASVLHALVVIFNQELADLTRDRNLLKESSPNIPIPDAPT